MARALRKDAAERRRAILAAASHAFAEQGYNVPLDVIADRAGVGRATLYRNFADRSTLALAVFETQLQELATLTRARGDDPQVFFWFIDRLADLLARNAGLDTAMREARDTDALGPIRLGLIEAGGEALERTKAAGLIRADLGQQDIRAIAMILGAGANRPTADEKDVFGRRIRALLLDGLRVRPVLPADETILA
ncbi:TetR/AcrR family transcriptional regulator [soil metagenome]